MKQDFINIFGEIGLVVNNPGSCHPNKHVSACPSKVDLPDPCYYMIWWKIKSAIKDVSSVI